MADLLFELGVEEVPVQEAQNLKKQLHEKFELFLAEESIKFSIIESAATNKKFMIYVANMNEKVEDKEESILGPSKKIAYTNDGEPSIALNKFLESHHASMEDVLEIETKKGKYIGINKKVEGEPTAEILKKIIPEILGSLIFTKTMVWNKSRIPFVRPISNILVFFNKQLLELEFAGIKSTNQTKGHPLLSDGIIKINSFKEYIELLHKNFVIIDEKERKEKILTEIRDIEEELEVKAQIDEEMINYYVFTNEYPVVFNGEFDSRYLDLPSEIISTFMTKEKKLIPVFDNNHQLTNIFIGVSNIPDENNFVARGNEKVIQATFEDAIFFWEKDKQDDFFSLRKKLKNITFQKGLGSFFEKTERLSKNMEFLLKETSNQQLFSVMQEAAFHCKNDLITRMVREFPSLQGIMGGLYLKELKQDEDLWKSIYLHYEPRGFVDQKMEHLGGALLSIVDKIDNIVGLISKGIKISSSKDPYGLRRDANGIIRSIIDLKLDFDLSRLIKQSAQNFSDTPQVIDELLTKVNEFFFSRMENIFKDFLNIPYDIVNSTLHRPELFIYQIYLRTTQVFKISGTDSIKQLTSIHKRLKNIIKDNKPHNISEELLVEPEEKILFEVFKESKVTIEKLILQKNFLEACSQILEMKPIIDSFFDQILVMADDEKIRQNRIGLLQKMDELLAKIADFSLIV